MIKKITLFIFGMFLALEVSASNAMLAWISEPELSESQVNVQRLENEEWLDIDVVYRSKERNYSPAVGSNGKGDVLLVWSATSTIRSVLRSRLYRDGQWQDVEILSDQGGETTTPAIIFDRNNNATVVWVSDHNGLDDVYLKRWNANLAQWSSAEKVNSKNNVPDILPSLFLDRQGNIEVHWRSYDSGSEAYVQRSRVYQQKGSQSNDDAQSDVQTGQTTLRELSSSDITMPENWQGSIGRAMLHFPDNAYVRGEKIK